MRRCLVPADGFYEWLRVDEKTKQPYAFGMKDDAPFAFAGVWDAWKAWLQSYSILTTFANELAARIGYRCAKPRYTSQSCEQPQVLSRLAGR